MTLVRSNFSKVGLYEEHHQGHDFRMKGEGVAQNDSENPFPACTRRIVNNLLTSKIYLIWVVIRLKLSKKSPSHSNLRIWLVAFRPRHHSSPSLTSQPGRHDASTKNQLGILGN